MATPSGEVSDTQAIVLIDGVCVLCSRWYRFVSARDRTHRFRFVVIQEPEGRVIAQRHGIDPQNPTTFILLEAGVAFVRSYAGLRILVHFLARRLTLLMRYVPLAHRERLYD